MVTTRHIVPLSLVHCKCCGFSRIAMLVIKKCIGRNKFNISVRLFNHLAYGSIILKKLNYPQIEDFLRFDYFLWIDTLIHRFCIEHLKRLINTTEVTDLLFIELWYACSPCPICEPLDIWSHRRKKILLGDWFDDEKLTIATDTFLVICNGLWTITMNFVLDFS